MTKLYRYDVRESRFVMLSFITILCIINYLRNSRDYTSFYNKFSGQADIILWTNKPDPMTFNQFIKKLKNRIIDFQEDVKHSMKKTIASEILQLNELKIKGVITEDEFEKSKNELLKSVENNPIGFKLE